MTGVVSMPREEPLPRWFEPSSDVVGGVPAASFERSLSLSLATKDHHAKAD
jgi:hypothetical protein